ncbi:MAG TPA: SBBP repeat-containing protein [Gemmataceae bacterium]|nr:SBBP repeat-containing protein [Gemmataceae bacterium]
MSGASLGAAYGQVPLSFEPNLGQTDSQVGYLSRGSGYTLFLNSREAVLSLQPGQPDASSVSVVNSQAQSALQMELVGANPAAEATGLERQASISNYFLGNNPSQWYTNVPNYAQVQYQGVYPGVDLVYYGNQSQLEYDFRVAPGADPSYIQLHFAGAQGISLDSAGDLLLQTGGGDVVEHAPVLYQQVDGVRHAVAGRYVLEANGQVGFQVGPYDTTQELIIDPVLSYSTYLGGSNSDAVTGIAVDSAGEAYVTGNTESTNFPIVNGYQNSLGGATDIGFVAKLNAAGTALVYSTYLGGNGITYGFGIAVDSSGDAYVTGQTTSTNFPTVNAIQSSPPGTNNGFVTKLNATGSTLMYSTYLGGNNQNGPDQAVGIALGSSGTAYIVGVTGSTNFPLVNAFQTTNAGVDVFVAEINAAGTALVFSTYLGGSKGAGADSIAVDSTGAIYVAGFTSSTNFPITANAIQATYGGGDDTGFVTKLSPGGASLVYSTYLGGSTEDEATGIAVDSAGNAYVAGQTYSTDFPTVNAFQSTQPGNESEFVTKINAAGTALVYSTYLGGSHYAFTGKIAVDSAGDAYVVGSTDSASFPTANPIQATYHGTGSLTSYNAYISELDPAGSALVFSTYLGGSIDDEAVGVALDSSGNVYVTGSTSSTDFPTANPLQANNAGGQDGFISKISFSHVPVVTAPANQSAGQGIAASISLGSFSETSVSGTWNVDVNWGDGTPDTVFSVSAQGSLGTKTHTYAAAGSDIVTITVTDPSENSGSATFNVSVYAPPVLTPPANQGAGQGIAAALALGSFSQPGVTGTWNVDVHWGDGTADTTFSTSAPGSLGTQTHAYSAAGTDTVTVTLTDPYGNTGTDTFTVSVYAPPVLTPPANQGAGQGIAAALALGSFSQPGVTGTWSVDVHWGDGTADTTFSTSAPGPLGTQTHTYSAPGADTVTVTVTDPYGNTGSDTFTVSVHATPVVVAPANQSAGESIAASISLGSFSETGVSGTWNVDVNWGDGTPDTVFNVSTQGSLGAQTHTYAAAGTDSVAITVTDPSGNSESATFNVSVFAPPVLTPPANQGAGLGIAAALALGSLSQPGVTGTWNVDVHWGDGTADTTFSTSAPGLLGTQTHAYNAAGTDTVTVTITDPYGNTGSDTFTVSVYAPPVLTPPANQAAGQGIATALALGSFSQSGVTGSWNVDVHWGDGSADTTFSASSPGSLGTRTHAYSAAGTDTVTVTLTDPYGNTGSDTFTVSVYAPPVLTPPANQAVGQGIAAALALGSFSQSGVTGPWNVDVNWGDGSADTSFSVDAPGSLGTQTHAYSAAGTDTVTVTITDPNGITGSDTFSVTVHVPPVLTPPANQAAGQGITTALALGSFSQTGVTGPWNVDVNWGDGTADTSFSASAPGSLGTQTHAFSAAGTDTVTVTIIDPNGITGSDTFSVSVHAPPVLTRPSNLSAGKGITTALALGSFSQPGVTGSWNVDVNWGDGTHDTVFSVSTQGSLGTQGHTYAAAGTDTVTVTLTDPYGNTGSDTFAVSVYAPPVLMPPANQAAGKGITTALALGSFSQPGVTGTWDVDVHWGDGTADTTFSANAPGSLGTQTHAYSAAGTDTVTVTLTDPYGNTGSDNFTVSVDATPVLTPPANQAADQGITTAFALGAFIQPGVTGPWNVDVHWGDGAADTTFSTSAPGSLGTQTHAYGATGTDSVTITVTDPSGDSGSATFNVSVYATPVLTPPFNQTAGQGIAAALALGSFSQPGVTGPWNVDVHWGDGTADTTFSASSQGSLGTRTHAYSAAGTNTVTVTLTDPNGITDSNSFTVSVFSPPVLTPPSNQSAGKAITAALALGSFSQPGVTGPWNVDVHWGDGTADTTFSASSQGSLGTLTHAYSAAGTDTVTVTVTLTDPYGNKGSDTFTVSVFAPPVLTPPANQGAGKGIATALALGSFSQPGVTGPWNVEVQWGDGTADTTFSASAPGSLGTQTHAYSAAGTDTVTVTVTDPNGITGSDTFTVSAYTTPVTVSPGSLPSDTINVAYDQTITGSGGTGNISLVVSNVQNAIAGLSIPSSGTNAIALTGTPTATGTETFTITATDQFGVTAKSNYSITVNPVVTLSPGSLPADTINVAYNQAIISSGGAGNIRLVVSNVQNAIAGSKIPGSGTNAIALTGTPTATGTETFTVTATDQVGVTAQTNYSITVNPVVTLSPSSLPAGATNDAYNQTISASGGTGNINLVVSNVQNPIAGLNVPGSGANSLAITGTPTAAGTETFTVTATDQAGGMTQTSFSITSLAGTSTVKISGVVFFDHDSSGVLNAGDTGLAGRTVFLDLNNSGQLEPGDPSTVTAADGSFQFTGLAPGAYTVREEITSDNVALTSPASEVVTATGDVTGINFGNVIYNPAFPVYPTADLYGSQPNPDPMTAYVTGLYHAILGRNPDPSGLVVWVNAINAGMPDAKVASLFVNSREHRQDQADYYYESFLGRTPDAASAFWVNELINGGSEAEVIEGILTSQEYTAEHTSNAAFVNELFFQLLGRQADSGGADYWEQELASAMSRADVVAGFLNSQESAELATASFYSAFLHRADDQAGKDSWVEQLTSQAQTLDQVAVDFLSTPPQEFLSNAGKTVTGNG